jgi:type IV secretory pathway VirB2 component (pilin)
MNLDPSVPQSNALVAATDWVQSTLTGTLATTVAVIAVACFGLMLLSGRLPKRRGAQLILGCFIVFGASSIAAGMMAVVSPANTAEPPIELAVTQPTPATPQPVAARNYDPYAGAALPPRR